MNRLVKYIRTTEAALGTGEKVIYESEMPSLSKLRRSNWRSPQGK